jgi:hypothetical protein
MIGRWAAALAVVAALASTAQAGEGVGPSDQQRYVRIFPGYLYALPLPMTSPLRAPALRLPG